MKGSLHHVEIWVEDLPRTLQAWEWLLERLGYRLYQKWGQGRSFKLGDTYVVFEQSPALVRDPPYDRCRSGLNHLAFHAGTRAEVDALVAEAVERGWTLMYPDRHPFAGGARHYAAYLEDEQGFEIELVADA